MRERLNLINDGLRALFYENMDEFQEMMVLLNCAIPSMELVAEVTERAKAMGRDYTTALAHKNIEDGFLRNLGNASPEQLEQLRRLISGNFFCYYSELNDLVNKVETLEFVDVK
jgi:hypothetical protein